MPNYVAKELCNDLYREFIRIKREHESRGIFLSRVEICKIIQDGPASRFYITSSTALRRVIRQLENKNTLASRGRRAQMHRELFRRYLQLRETYGRERAIQMAIEQPAPSYYLSTRSICNLLYNAIKK